jgi:hypothetical protein
MIELKEDIRAMWFVTLPPKADWLAAAQELEDGTILLTYRFRYYNSDEPFDSKDTKNWYEGKITEPLAEVVEKTSRIAAELARAAHGEKYELIRGTATLDQFVDQFTSLPFSHCKKFTLGDTQ